MDSKENREEKNLKSDDDTIMGTELAPPASPSKKPASWIWVLMVIPIVIILRILFGIGTSSSSALFWFFAILSIIVALILATIIFLIAKGHKIAALFTFLSAVIFAILFYQPITIAFFMAGYHDITSNRKDIESEKLEEYMDNQEKADWTFDDILELDKEKYSVEEVVEKYGKATEATQYSFSIELDYHFNSINWKRGVSLEFVKDNDGDYMLSTFTGGVAAPNIQTYSFESSKSDWTVEEYESLAVGDRKTGKGGALWSEIYKNHPQPQEADIIFNDFEYEPKYQLEVEYSPLEREETNPRFVILKFARTKDGTDYRLVEKYIEK